MSHSKETKAPPTLVSEDWSDLPWRKLEQHCYRLQKRIYRASEHGNQRAVHRLQHLLMRSRSARLLAVRRVTQDNQGKKTAGIDGIKSVDPAQRLALAEAIHPKQHQKRKAKPVHRVGIPKPGKPEKRPLGIPMIRSYCLSLQEILGMSPGAAWQGEDGSATLLYSTTHVDYCAGGRWFQCRRTGLRKVSMFSGVSVIQRGPCGMARTASNLPSLHHSAIVETSSTLQVCCRLGRVAPIAALPSGSCAGPFWAAERDGIGGANPFNFAGRKHAPLARHGPFGMEQRGNLRIGMGGR